MTQWGIGRTTPKGNSKVGFLQPEPPFVNYGVAGQPRTRAAGDRVGLGAHDHAHRQPTATSFGAYPMEQRPSHRPENVLSSRRTCGRSGSGSSSNSANATSPYSISPSTVSSGAVIS